jgi:hypothetical protein
MIVNDELERTVKGSGHGLFYCTNQEFSSSSIYESHTEILAPEQNTAKLHREVLRPHRHKRRYISGNTNLKKLKLSLCLTS